MELPLVQCKKCKHLEKITNEYLCPFDWCENVLDSPDRDLQRRCKHYQAATHGDIIRAMNDEELTEWLVRFAGASDLHKKSILNWLKSEAE